MNQGTRKCKCIYVQKRNKLNKNHNLCKHIHAKNIYVPRNAFSPADYNKNLIFCCICNGDMMKCCCCWLKHDPIRSDFSRISTSHIHINMPCSSTLCAEWLHLQYSLAPRASEVSVFASSCAVEHKNNGRLQAALSPIAWKSPWLKRCKRY